MQSITVSILLAFVAQVSGEGSTNDAQDKYIDDLVDKMTDRAVKSGADLQEALNHVQDMDGATLGKPGQLAANKLPMARASAAAPAALRLKSLQGPRVMPSMAQRGVAGDRQAQEPNIEEFKQQMKLALKGMTKNMDPAAVALLAGAAAPLNAHAAEMTPSLNNLLNSVVAGGVVLGAIGAAVVAVSNFDPVDRA